MLVHGNALLALAAAVLWGGGDFSGGMGVKHAGGTMGGGAARGADEPCGQLALCWSRSRVLRGDAFPHGAALAWGLVAGVTGGLVADLFLCCAVAGGDGGFGGGERAAGGGDSGGGVDCAHEGSPGWLRLVGFRGGGVAIWLIAAGPNPEAKAADRRDDVAGGWGGRGVWGLLCGAEVCGARGRDLADGDGEDGEPDDLLAAGGWDDAGSGEGGEAKVRLTRRAVVWALATALLDTSGNLLFIAATRAGRLDVAAVLASLYPASTILLAAWTLHERPTRRQGLGMAVALAAVVMITL